MNKLFLVLFCILTSSYAIVAQDIAILATDKTNHNWGQIYMGDKYEHVFTFTNKGNIPLIIFEATSSCGCTVPQKPDKPIMPGETGSVKVVFNSEGRSGMQHKNVVVKANTDPEYTTFYLNGDVWIKPKTKVLSIQEQLNLKQKEKEAAIEAERKEQQRLYEEQEARKKAEYEAKVKAEKEAAKKKKKMNDRVKLDTLVEKIEPKAMIVSKKDSNYIDKLKSFFNLGESKDD